MALVCMHILYLSGGSSSAHFFSCHKWKRLRDGERITISLLCRYFLYRCTSSNPQPLILRSKPPVRKQQKFRHIQEDSENQEAHITSLWLCLINSQVKINQLISGSERGFSQSGWHQTITITTDKIMHKVCVYYQTVLLFFLSKPKISDDTSLFITYVDEIRPILARHPKPKVSPESSFLSHYLRQKMEINVLIFSLIHSSKCFVSYFTYQLLLNRGQKRVITVDDRWVVLAKEHWIVHFLTQRQKEFILIQVLRTHIQYPYVAYSK